MKYEDNKTNTNPVAESYPLPEMNSTLVEQAEVMIWKLLDEQLCEDDCHQLKQMIMDHEEIRQRYLECIQVHTGLYDLLAKNTKSPQSAPQSPVLGMLGEVLTGEMTGVDSQPPVC